MMQTSFSGGLLTPTGENKDGDGSTGTPPSETLLPPTGYNQHGSTSIFEGFTSRGHSFAEGLELVSAAADHHRTLLSSFQDPILTGVLGMEEAENLVLLYVWANCMWLKVLTSFFSYFSNLQDCICLLDPQRMSSPEPPPWIILPFVQYSAYCCVHATKLDGSIYCRSGYCIQIFSTPALFEITSNS